MKQNFYFSTHITNKVESAKRQSAKCEVRHRSFRYNFARSSQNHSMTFL